MEKENFVLPSLCLLRRALKFKKIERIAITVGAYIAVAAVVFFMFSAGVGTILTLLACAPVVLMFGNHLREIGKQVSHQQYVTDALLAGEYQILETVEEGKRYGISLIVWTEDDSAAKVAELSYEKAVNSFSTEEREALLKEFCSCIIQKDEKPN